MKADFLLSLCELVVGGKDGLQPIEKTVVDRCVRLVYREQALGLATEKTPLLQDLYEELLKQPEPEARRVATALELYCTGSLNLFNHPTNVKTDSRVVCIVLKTWRKPPQDCHAHHKRVCLPGGGHQLPGGRGDLVLL